MIHEKQRTEMALCRLQKADWSHVLKSSLFTAREEEETRRSRQVARQLILQSTIILILIN